MNKKFINGLLLCSLLVGTAGCLTSCKDYDDDIDNLQSQINGIKTTVADLQAKIESGEVITTITPAADGGISVQLKNGQTYIIGQRGETGATGAAGKDGISWTIGADGFWYQNGTKTDYRAIGETGAQGEQGPQGIQGTPGTNGTNGTNGAPGQNGKYYVPNENGTWDIYQDGKLVEHTTIRWKGGDSSSMTGFFDGKTLSLYDVPAGKDSAGKETFKNVSIEVGIPVGSIEFVPTKIDADFPYATTDNAFYNLASYIQEDKVDKDGKFIAQTGWNKSNILSLTYRINPTDANVYDYAAAAFIGRKVSRAEGDLTGSKSPLSVVTTTETVGETPVAKYFENQAGEITVKAAINAANLSTEEKSATIAALQLMNGQVNYTVSDYITVSTSAIDVVLCDSVKTKNAADKKAVTFYDRTKGLANAAAETDAFIKQFVALNAPCNAQLVYTGTLDLNKLPGLYSQQQEEFLAKLGFVGMSYEFSLPANYLADDVQKTNQQWYVSLDKATNTLSVDAKALNNMLTPAIGRTPVVRVDAFLTGNDGARHLVASSYIKIDIVEEATSTENKPALTTELTPAAEFEYHNITAAGISVDKMDYQQVSLALYGKSGLTSENFWNNYGGTGATKQYEVKIEVLGKNDQSIELAKEKCDVKAAATTVADGITVTTTLDNQSQTTSKVAIDVNNKVKTENTYKDVDGKGAQYTVTITIPANDNTKYGNIVITKVFYVKEDCKPYTWNENYYAGASVDGHQNVVVTKGTLVNNAWALQMNIAEVFTMVDGKNIFSYYNTVNNASAIAFALNPATQTGVKYENQIISLTAPLSTAELWAPMKYDVTLANGETCTFNFTIKFQNPFVGTTGNAVKLKDSIAVNTTGDDVAKQLRVNDTNGQAIYSWDAATSKLALSTLATTGLYHLAAPTVAYAFDTESADYKTFTSNLAPNSVFKIDPATGVVTFQNLGAKLQKTYSFNIKATVTFGNISIVTCTIPFTIQPDSAL